MEKSKTCWFRKLISEEMWRKNLVQKRKNFLLPPRLQQETVRDPSPPSLLLFFLLRIQSSLPGVGFPQICSDSGLHACVWAQDSLTCRRAGDSKDASKPGILVSLQTARTGKFVS